MSATAAARPLTVPSAAAEAVRERLRDAAAARRPLRIVGRGTWLDAGRPVAADGRLEVAPHAGIVEYVPGDLTLTAAAGTTLAEIAAVTRAEGQWLGLDPFGGGAGSIGATVATASYGPLAHAFGTPRDVVLGVEFVTGAGDVVRGGGRVVKNVAGFDLTRLVTGSWGTLGVVTEVTVRLRALPEADVTVALPLRARADEAHALLARLRAAPIAPLALEMISIGLARRLGLSADGAVVLARLGGNDGHVKGQLRALAGVGDTAEVPGDVWERLSTFEASQPGPRAVVRRSIRPASIGAAWNVARTSVSRLGGEEQMLMHATVGRGVVRIATSADDDALRDVFRPHVEAARLVEASFPASRRDAVLRSTYDEVREADPIFERLPAPLWPELAPSRATDRLSRGVRAAFDPQRILNPGILGE